MPRKPMVTRTIQTTICTVLCLDLRTKETLTKEVRLPRSPKPGKLINMVRDVIDSDEFKAVYIESTRVEKAPYGMTELEFLKYAHPLPL